MNAELALPGMDPRLRRIAGRYARFSPGHQDYEDYLQDLRLSVIEAPPGHGLSWTAWRAAWALGHARKKRRKESAAIHELATAGFGI